MPEWAARLTSTQPTLSPFLSAKVRMGMSVFRLGIENCAQPMTRFRAIGRQDPINGRRAHAHELTAECFRHPQFSMPLRDGNELVQKGRQALGTDAIRRFPRYFQSQHKVGTVLRWPPTALGSSRSNGVQQPDRRLWHLALLNKVTHTVCNRQRNVSPS